MSPKAQPGRSPRTGPSIDRFVAAKLAARCPPPEREPWWRRLWLWLCPPRRFPCPRCGKLHDVSLCPTVLRRPTTGGRFAGAKAKGGDFRGVRREGV